MERNFNHLNISPAEMKTLEASARIDYTINGTRDLALIRLVLGEKLTPIQISKLNTDDLLLRCHNGKFKHYIMLFDKSKLFKINARTWQVIYNDFVANKDAEPRPLFTTMGRRLTSEEIFDIINNYLVKN
jgi:hypothetical protein